MSELDRLRLLVAKQEIEIARLKKDGWIKEERYLDFGLETAEDVSKLLDEYVYYFNYRRPAAALGF